MFSRLSSNEPTETCPGSKNSLTISATKCPATICPRRQTNTVVSKLLKRHMTKLGTPHHNLL